MSMSRCALEALLSFIFVTAAHFCLCVECYCAAMSNAVCFYLCVGLSVCSVVSWYVCLFAFCSAFFTYLLPVDNRHITTLICDGLS